MTKTPEPPIAPAPDGPRYELAWAMLVCALVALTLAHPALSGGFLVNTHSDQYIAGYAFREYAANSLRTTGSFPLWNPYLFGGLPYIDAMHGDIFYPTFLLRTIMSTDMAMTWGMIIHFWLAGVAAYALFRAHRLPFAAALIGGLAYMMSGMVAGLVSPGHDGKIFISALFPITLLVLRAGIISGRRWAWGALALVVGLAVLTPHPQMLQYLLLCSGAYALWISFGEHAAGAPVRAVAIKRLGLALGAVAIGMLIGAIQFYPVTQYVGWSPRAGGAGWEHAISYSMPPEELINTFLPEFSGILDNYWGRNLIHLHSEYLGIAALLIAAAAYGASDAGRRRAAWFWTGVLAVTAVWALGGYTPFYHLVYAIVPGTKFFRAPSTIMLFSAFAVSSLVALGVTRILAEEIGKKYFIIAASALGIVTLLGMTGAFANFASTVVMSGLEGALEANRSAIPLGAMRMFVFGAIALAVVYGTVSKKIPANAAPWILGAVLIADLWTVERHYWMFSPRATSLYASDAAIDRIKSDSVQGRVLAIQLGDAAAPNDPFLRGDALMSNGVRSILGYHGNELGRYQLEYDKERRGAGVVNPTFWEATTMRWIYTNVAELPAPLAAYERVLGPVKNAAGSDVYLFKSKDDFRPAWIASAIMKRPDQVVLGAFMSNGLPLHSIALFDTTSSVTAQELTAAPPASLVRARMTHWEPGAMNIELDAPAPAGSALVVSENFYLGWKATVDGEPAIADRVDYTLIGVPLKTGARKIELRFTSASFEKGKTITLVAIALAFLFTLGGLTLDFRRAHVPDTAERALVIIPTYNERENLTRIVDAVLLQDPRLNVLVVDDGSPDGTGAIADEIAATNPRMNVIHRAGKMGLGTAYIAGFRWALERDFEYVFEMDADFSHDPQHLPEFLEAAADADVVVGARYLEGRVTVVNWPMTRLMLSYTANMYARTVTGLKLWDLTAGFKCWRRRVLAAIDLDAVRSNGYGFQIETKVRAWRKGFRIKEIPIVFTDRIVGSSKMSGAIVREAMWIVWRLRWWTLTGKI